MNYLRKRTPGRTPEPANPCELCLDSCANYVLNPNTSKRTVVMSEDIVPNEPPDGISFRGLPLSASIGFLDS